MTLPAAQAIIPSAIVIIITGSIARPSKPSVRFTALELPTIIKIEISTNTIPKSKIMSLKKGTIYIVSFGTLALIKSARAIIEAKTI